MISVVCIFALALGTQPQPEVTLNASLFYQGETVRLEATGIPESCSLSFNGAVYPVYKVDSLLVGLVGIPADFPTGNHELQLSGNSVSWHASIQILPVHYPRQKVVFPADKSELLQLDITEERNAVRGALNGESEERLWKTVFVKPVDGKITTAYGAKRNGGYHRGIDIGTQRGTIVKAPAPGRVSLAEAFPIHGKTVVLDHGQGVSTVYCHLDTILVEEGMIVDGGSSVGTVGNSGLSTASHLHWGLYVHGIPVNPDSWLSRQY